MGWEPSPRVWDRWAADFQILIEHCASELLGSCKQEISLQIK